MRPLGDADRAALAVGKAMRLSMSFLRSTLLSRTVPVWRWSCLRGGSFVWRENPARFLKFALQVFDIEPIDETDEAIEDAVTAAIDELQAFFVDLGMPRTLGEFGIAPEDVDKLLPTLKANKGEVFGGFKKLTLEDAKAIYLSAF